MPEEFTSDVWRVAVFVLLVVAFQVAVAQWSLEREAKRRWQHALTGQALVLASYYIPAVQTVGVGALLLAAVLICYLRFYQTHLYFEAFGSLLRPSERDADDNVNESTPKTSSAQACNAKTARRRQLPGAFYFLIGTALTLRLFPLDIARYAVMCLSWADPTAAWVGQWSRSKIRINSSASLGGCLACFFTSMAIGCLFLQPELGWIHVAVGAIACTVAEASRFGINDNILIPLATATAVQLVSW
jgi:dolichol kinase